MSILAWFRGLFGKPTKKRQAVDNEGMYVGRDRPQHKQYYTLPQPGKLNELEVRFILGRFATSEASQVARKLNKMGYLTPRGKKWNINTVNYWRLSDSERQTKRVKSLDYFRNRPRKMDNADETAKNSGLQTAVYNWPPAGMTSERTARKVATDLAKMGLNTTAIAAVMNHHGLLTPRGKKWTAERAQYWAQNNGQLERRREYWRKRDKANRQRQTVIFRNADLRPRQNGVN